MMERSTKITALLTVLLFAVNLCLDRLQRQSQMSTTPKDGYDKQRHMSYIVSAEKKADGGSARSSLNSDSTSELSILESQKKVPDIDDKTDETSLDKVTLRKEMSAFKSPDDKEENVPVSAELSAAELVEVQDAAGKMSLGGIEKGEEEDQQFYVDPRLEKSNGDADKKA